MSAAAMSPALPAPIMAPRLNMPWQADMMVTRYWDSTAAAAAFIDTFMNEEFCEAQKLFTYGFNRRTGQYEIVDRDWRKVKQQLLFGLTNFGNPVITVNDANFENRGELLLEHRHEGIDLDYEKAVETLRNLHYFWKRPVNILTKYNSQAKLVSFDGKEAKEKDA